MVDCILRKVECYGYVLVVVTLRLSDTYALSPYMFRAMMLIKYEVDGSSP